MRTIGEKVTLRMRYNLRTKMGLCLRRGDVVEATYKVIDDGIPPIMHGFSIPHPLYENGTNPNVTLFIPEHYASVL